jgi:hypothetical protein
MCDKHYRRYKQNGDPLKTKRPEDWGKRSNHPLNETWTQTARSKEGRVKRWDDMYAFVEDVGEKPGPNYRLKKLDPRQPFGPENFFWQELSLLPEDVEARERNAMYQRIWRQKNPDRAKSYDLKRHFGITLEQYGDMLVEQGHACAICNKPDRWRSLAVDHCHKSGKVRGLLCGWCNTALGKFEDDPDRLTAAISYLERHRGHST